jgi:hypothetical protein
MTIISYYAINPQCYGLLSTEGFHYLLKNNPNLDLVEVSYDDETGDEIFTSIKTPLHSEPENCIALIDRTDDDKFMWVLYDDEASVEEPSDALIEALTIMDAFSIKVEEVRIFIQEDCEYDLDDPRLLEADFDFTTGEYEL